MASPSIPPAGKFLADDLLKKSFKHACRICRNISADGILDEETITGALLGALASSFPLLSEEGSPKALSERFFWFRYSKKSARHRDSEAANGADFALVLVDDVGLARVALFQAKRSKVKHVKGEWTIDIRHVSKSVSGKKVAQLVALEERANNLLVLNKTPATGLDEGRLHHLSWIHYLAYGDGEPLCIPMTRMSNVYEMESALRGSVNRVAFLPKKESTLFGVLLSGLRRRTDKWLTIRTKTFFDSLPQWLDMMPVVVASSSRGWKHVPENRRAMAKTLKARSTSTSANRSKGSTPHKRDELKPET